MKILPFRQNTPEWEEARLGLATASAFRSIMAKGRDGGESLTRDELLLKLALERVTRVAHKGFESYATRMGHEREPDARLAYEVETGRIVTQVGFVQHDRLLAGCSPDGLQPKGGLEIKSPQQRAHRDALRLRRLPPAYVPQVQGNMWLCDRRWWDFVSWNPEFLPRSRLVIVRVERDQSYIDKLAAEVEVFLQEVAEEEATMRRIERELEPQPLPAGAVIREAA